VIFVDSSVWIDYFRGTLNAETDWLHAQLDQKRIVVGDLVLAEVLRGFERERDAAIAQRLMLDLTVVNLVGQETALQSAQYYRLLRRMGITVRKTIDTLIATYCIRADLPLLYTERDFDPFVAHLGLRSALD
jgi:predicted nucleic acid-binding protein